MKSLIWNINILISVTWLFHKCGLQYFQFNIHIFTMLDKAYVDVLGFQHNSTLKRTFNNTFCHFCKTKLVVKVLGCSFSHLFSFYRNFLTDIFKLFFLSRQFYFSATVIGWSYGAWSAWTSYKIICQQFYSNSSL